MALNIYECRDYRTYLVDLIASLPNNGRGRRKALAENVGAQVSYVSAVLNLTAHFSVEQGEAVTRYFGFSSHESEYFMFMLQRDRAGTTELRRFWERQLVTRKASQVDLKKRLKMPESVRAENEARYYSSWHYGMVHVAISIPALRTRDALSTKLGIALPRIDEILQFLLKTNLISKDGAHYKLLRPLTHLDRTSALITKHHVNWRLRTLLALDSVQDCDLHYSSVLTLSEKDFPKVREILTKALSEAMQIITASPEEKVAALCLDFFNV